VVAVSFEATGNMSVSIKTTQFDERLPTDKELNLYRIIQELISNTLKHAQATQISILLKKEANYLHLMISDNGVGFNNDKIFNGIGLRNIRSRVHKIGGTLLIESKLGTGTKTEITVPV
jgi:signal transduction histidine kinase